MGIEGPTEDIESRITEAASLIRSARYLTAFTGAGISVESGIPPFRGAGGLWGKYDPRTLEIEYFLRHPEQAWPVIKEIFYDNFGRAKPNKAHEVLAAWEAQGAGPNGGGLLKTLITQNIDSVQWN
jgi:NAD-dependent deacetylase